tara:strand:+ start:210 stop:482 length:273 start_codon:yes stop_codon:yes gene_type:complete
MSSSDIREKQSTTIVRNHLRNQLLFVSVHQNRSRLLFKKHHLHLRLSSRLSNKKFKSFDTQRYHKKLHGRNLEEQKKITTTGRMCAKLDL